MNRIARSAAALLAAVGLAATAACGASNGTAPEGTEPIELTFLGYSIGTPDLGGQAMQGLIDRFQEQNPGITVRTQPVAVADVLTKLKADTAAGSPPDVAQIGWSKMAEAYADLPVAPVQEIAGDQWAAHAEGMAPNLMAAVADDGVVKAMPFTMSIPTLYYNADLFRAAGLDPDTPPTSMAEVREAALAIARSGRAGAYLAVADVGKSDYLTQSIINTAGGSMVGPGGEITVDSPRAVDALSQVQELTTAGAQPAVSTADALSLFGSGRLGMLLASTGALVSLETASTGTFDLRTAGFPTFGRGAPKPTYSGAGLAVLTDDEDRRQAAWKFVRFMSSAEAYTVYAEKIGYLPLRPALAEDPAYLGDHFARNPRLLPAVKQLDTVEPYQVFPGGQANRAVVTLQDEAVEPIVLRGADPATTLRAAAEKIRGLSTR
ncbi:ABC transporter substrate-binding protein [Pseudonocardia sp. EC080610-09]|uniref:ABC transporter substrate-binding protein n=1 Tax=unclassified Pseudonocardia TaxID=2619320 RepID=UPI0007068D05|nr:MULTISPECIES: ABC transporter substrate-binding protein [unclassified Pseudonocardia]ALL76886.1 ABC transporter substrate-binding protein [Pseudonocardia sp. EC080610-09]ALL83917.1 ABC transporter substrate-binding protein [Pseudonocardia sp. EC080619-01]